MATITFTTRATNKTVSPPAEEAIERLFADADEWFAFQHRAPETEMELFFASIYDAAKTTIDPYATEIEVNGVPMAISIKEDGGIAIRPGGWVSGMYEDWEKTEAFANEFIHAMFGLGTRTVNTHDAYMLAILVFRILANGRQPRTLFRWAGRVIPVFVHVLHVSGHDVDSHDCSRLRLSSI